MVLVGREQAGAGTSFDRHVGNGQPTLDAHRFKRASAILDHVTDTAVDSDPADEVENEVLWRNAKPSFPSTLISSVLDGFINRVWVARTCSTSLVPIPKASAPSAPCAAVWLSPQTIVVPGRVKSLLGPDHVNNPLLGRNTCEIGDAELGDVPFERGELGGTVGIVDRDRLTIGIGARGRRQIVVRDRQSEVGAAHLPALVAQSGERLG